MRLKAWIYNIFLIAENLLALFLQTIFMCSKQFCKNFDNLNTWPKSNSLRILACKFGIFLHCHNIIYIYASNTHFLIEVEA